jgi:hypothetical protein
MRDTEDTGSSPERSVMPGSHRRLLIIMAVLGVAGSLAGGVFVSARFGLGLLLGLGLAFVNYFWLRYSLAKAFAAADEGERPRISVLRYLGRYFALGLVIAFFYATDILPVAAVVIGLAGFGFAVFADGLIRIFTSFSNRKEI